MEILDNLGINLLYDIFKMTLSFIFARYLYETYIMTWLWGGWRVIVKNNQQIITERLISPATLKRINSDETDFSTYIKGLISPFEWLKIDILSMHAKTSGFIKQDKVKKVIIIDLSKNKKIPSKPLAINHLLGYRKK